MSVSDYVFWTQADIYTSEIQHYARVLSILEKERSIEVLHHS